MYLVTVCNVIDDVRVASLKVIKMPFPPTSSELDKLRRKFHGDFCDVCRVLTPSERRIQNLKELAQKIAFGDGSILNEYI